MDSGGPLVSRRCHERAWYGARALCVVATVFDGEYTYHAVKTQPLICCCSQVPEIA